MWTDALKPWARWAHPNREDPNTGSQHWTISDDFIPEVSKCQCLNVHRHTRTDVQHRTLGTNRDLKQNSVGHLLRTSDLNRLADVSNLDFVVDWTCWLKRDPKNAQKDEVRSESDFSNRKTVWLVAHPFRQSLLCDVRLFQLRALNLNFVSGRIQMNETDQN